MQSKGEAHDAWFEKYFWDSVDPGRLPTDDSDEDGDQSDYIDPDESVHVPSEQIFSEGERKDPEDIPANTEEDWLTKMIQEKKECVI